MIKHTRLGLLIAGLCLALSHQSGFAAVDGDPDSGKVKFYTCEGCHSIVGQTNAFPTYHVPKIGGQNAEYVISALKSYANGSRSHGSMLGNAISMTDRDMADVGAYVARFRSVNESVATSGNVLAGKQKSAACASCHGDEDKPAEGAFPRLASQYESYLVKALHDYKDGVRKHAMMSAIASSLSDEDILDISAYYASQHRGLLVVKDVR